MKKIDFSAQLGKAEKLSNEKFNDTPNRSFLKMEDGELSTLALTNVSEKFNGKDGEQDAVVFVDKNNEEIISTAAAVVSQCKRIAEKNELPVIVRLIHKGKKQSAKSENEYADIEVRFLSKV